MCDGGLKYIGHTRSIDGTRNYQNENRTTLYCYCKSQEVSHTFFAHFDHPVIRLT